MDFIVVAICMAVIAIIIGIKTNSYNISECISEKKLYDKETLEIMKRYDLITEDQYKNMIDSIENL